MIFGSCEKPGDKGVAVAFIMSWREGGDGDGDGDGDGADDALGRLGWFRAGLYFSFGMRRDALFEVCEAVLCRQERVLMLAELCLEPECRRGHGAVYDALNVGQVHVARLRRAPSALPLPPRPGGTIPLAAAARHWLRPDARCSP